MTQLQESVTHAPPATSMRNGMVLLPKHKGNASVLCPRGLSRPPAVSLACNCIPSSLVISKPVNGLYTSYDALACWYAQTSADNVRRRSTTGGKRSAAATLADSKNASPSTCCCASQARTAGPSQFSGKTLAWPGVGVRTAKQTKNMQRRMLGQRFIVWLRKVSTGKEWNAILYKCDLP